MDDAQTLDAIKQIAALIQGHAWVPVAALVIALLARLTKQDNIFPVNISPRWRVWVVFGLGVVSGILQTIVSGVIWWQALLQGLLSAVIAIATHQVTVESILGGKEPPVPGLMKKTAGSGPAAVAILVLAIGGLLSSTAQAQVSDRQFGGCVQSGSLGEVCLGPSAAVTVGQLNFTTGKFTGGVLPGVGYGATAWANQWYQTGLAMYLAFRVGGGEPNSAVPSLMLSFADYVRAGVGLGLTEQTAGGLRKEWVLNFAFGADFGGPTPQAAKAARAAFEARDGQ